MNFHWKNLRDMDLYDKKKLIAAQKTGVEPATAANFEFWQFYINQGTKLR